MKNKTYRNIDWYEIEMNVKLLAKKIKQQFNLQDIKGIVGVERGGLIPAVMLSHFLNKQYIDRRDYVRFSLPEEKVIFVDDIADSGETLDIVDDNLIICSLYLREHTCCEKIKDKLIFAEKIENDDWLKFPWELEEVSLAIMCDEEGFLKKELRSYS